MRRRYRNAFWPVVLIVLAVGVFGRGRSDTAPKQAILETARPAAERAVSTTTETPPRNLPTAVRADSQKVPPARHRPDRNAQLRLRVVGVHDGDTLTGLDDTKTQYKIRFDAIDAPELGQPFGQASKKALSEKVFGKDVLVTVKTRDKYGRTVGHVLIDGRDVNLEMLEEGMAWHYSKYDRNKRLQAAEISAKEAKIGLWSEEGPVPPWEWRASTKPSNKQRVR